MESSLRDLKLFTRVWREAVEMVSLSKIASEGTKLADRDLGEQWSQLGQSSFRDYL